MKNELFLTAGEIAQGVDVYKPQISDTHPSFPRAKKTFLCYNFLISFIKNCKGMGKLCGMGKNRFTRRSFRMH